MNVSPQPYRGRFAPSPTGPLHAGSLVAALASWLDARAHGGTWLVRIEDVDGPRCVPGADAHILAQLAAFGLVPDEPPLWQSSRFAHYQTALDPLIHHNLAYPCGCTRRDIAQTLAQSGVLHERHAETPYPGTCRAGLQGKPARAVRLRVNPQGLRLTWHDRRLGTQHSQPVDDCVLKRADGLWAYQLAVVVDDAAQGITHVVRGADLADNTPRQIHLQRCLGLPTPHYLHVPVVRGADGEKLSKQNGATALAADQPLMELRHAGHVLGLTPTASNVDAWLVQAVAQWHPSIF
jgi:glutamyl-Q tRNA(Asp) synthetase